LINKKGDKFNIIYDQSFKPTKNDTTTKGIPHARYYVPSENDYIKVFKIYPNGKIPEYIEKNKIIITFKAGKQKAHLYPKYYSSPIGTTNNTMYQTMTKNDNKENLISFFNSKLIHFVLLITQYSESPNHINEFKILNMFSKPNTGNLRNDNDIYRYYGITEEERVIIEKFNN